MYQAIRGALTLALLLLVLQIFFPGLTEDLVAIISKMINIVLSVLDQVVSTLPQE